MLSVRDLYAGYGNKTVLRGVSLDVPRGAVVALLGANGTRNPPCSNRLSGFCNPHPAASS